MLDRGGAWLAVRHDGPAVVHAGPQTGDAGTAGRAGPRMKRPRSRERKQVRQGCRHVRWIRHVDLFDRLGQRRACFRRAGRSHRPCQDDAPDDFDLFAFHRPERFSRGFWDFAFYRFLTGLGVGGEFAVGVALVAEVMPDTARALRAGAVASAIGGGQYHRRPDQYRVRPDARVGPDRRHRDVRHQAHRVAADVRRGHGAGAVGAW